MRRKLPENFIRTCLVVATLLWSVYTTDAFTSAARTRRPATIIGREVRSPYLISGPRSTSTAASDSRRSSIDDERVFSASHTSPRYHARGVQSSCLYMTSPDDSELSTSKRDKPPPKVKVYPQRWVQLGYLSLLALLSDWICFSVAATPSTFETSFGHSAASLIDMFLFTNVASCFLVTDVVNRVGLQKAIQGAAVLMTVGCWLRSGVSFLIPVANALGMLDMSGGALGETLLMSNANTNDWMTLASPELVPYPLLVLGTICVGAAQPFFQCTPPLLSAQWFASSERATSTAVALNFNQIGIATAFLVGGAMATSTSGLISYFGVISVLCSVVMVGTLLQFENLPPTPPSTSELEKLESGEKEPPFFQSVKQFFSRPGFARPLAAFICSISITNVVGAFIDELMERGGVIEQFSIDLAGAGFEFAILIGGIIIGGYVDKSKEYKTVTLACLAGTIVALLPLGLTEHAIGNEPILLVMALLGLGVAAGPVQPINAELAVDVTYPGDETAVESVQQIGGNLFSALLVPVAEIALQQDFQLFPKNPEFASDIRGDVVLLMTIAAVTYGYFSGFDAPLRRTAADCGDEGRCDASDVIKAKQNSQASSSTSKERLEKLEEIIK